MARIHAWQSAHGVAQGLTLGTLLGFQRDKIWPLSLHPLDQPVALVRVLDPAKTRKVASPEFMPLDPQFLPGRVANDNVEAGAVAEKHLGKSDREMEDIKRFERGPGPLQRRVRDDLRPRRIVSRGVV